MVPILDPILPVSGPLPADQARYAFEPKWDGFRALVYVEAGGLRVRSRRGTELTDRCRELAGLARAVGADALLDGELVVLASDGRPDFEALRGRVFNGRQGGPLVFVAFDVLHLAGADTTHLRYVERRRRLESLGLEGVAWRTTPAHPGEGSALFAATRDLGLEGVVGKALTSPYRPGVRSRTWVKTKHWRRQRFLVGGFAPADPHREQPAALLVGAPDEAGRLRYAGRVEFGFGPGEKDEIRRRLRPRAASPFVGWRARRGVEYAEPELAVEVQYLERTPAGHLRHASFKGLAAS